jgi:hypothetical protein
MLIDMIHDNHGEPPFKTRYRDPAVLRAYGYEAIVIPDALAAIPGARDEAATSGSPPPRQPVELEATVDARVRAALAQGMQVFFYGDALLLPRKIVSRQPEQYFCDDGTGRLCAGKAAVYAALREQVRELLARWPAAAGLVMRTSEVYPEATPHMVGSALQAGIGGACPVCRELSLTQRQVRFITCMHEAVVAQAGKTYVHRAWQAPTPGGGGGSGALSMHDQVEVYREVAQRVPQSPRLIFSFKFTRGDFLQGESFNPCLLADNRPKWIEFQCEREHEGKGAFPNYQAPVWRDLFGRLIAVLGEEQFRRQFDIWGWSRGGGWGGPYVQREEWIDANVHALAGLYRQGDVPAADLATAWAAATFGIAESSPPAPAIAELLMISPGTIRKLLYVAALPEDHAAASAPFLRESLLDVEAVWIAAGRVIDAGKANEAITEKYEALAAVDRIRQLFDIAAPDLPYGSQVRDLGHTLAYFGSFAGTVAHLFIGLVRFRQWKLGGRSNTELAEQTRRHLEAAQAQWQQHTRHHALLPGAPSVLHENTLWERTNDCLAAMDTRQDDE